MEKTTAYRKGEHAGRARKPRSSCPYNGPELRSEWFAGYDKAAAKLADDENVGSRIPRRFRDCTA